jgi:ElaA protein
VNWIETNWDDWDSSVMYAALRLRSDVFVVEQDCVYPDLDDKDVQSIHLIAMEENAKHGQSALAAARMVPPGVSYAEPSIGRVVTIHAERGGGLGRALMERAIRICQRHWPQQAIRISAQQYLIRFYEGFGFCCTGEGYLEDGIPHIEMLRPSESLDFWMIEHAQAVERFESALGAVPENKKNGSSESWGAAEIIQHLQLSEGGLWRYLKKKSNAQWSDLPGTDLDSDRGGIELIRLLESDRRWKDPTGGLISPAGDVTEPARIFDEWRKSHGPAWIDLKHSFQDARWWTVKLFKHPLAGYLSLSDALAFNRAHIVHHVAQLERLHS